MRLWGFRILLLIFLGGSLGCRQDAHGEGEIARGYVLFSPLLSSVTYLIDKRGRVVHTWESDSPPAVAVYLLDNGHLLRCAKRPRVPVFEGGYGGRIQELGWEGELLWDWTFPGDEKLQHHDIEPLANGNILAIAWERRSREEALRAGRRPNRVGSAGLWPDCVFEIRPLRPDGGEIVWQWCLWDHLVQDLDPGLENYGSISEHPELIDINGDRRPLRMTERLLRRLKGLGYVGGDAEVADFRTDFLHTNSIAYNPRLDQILLSVPRFHEIWVLDHSTTTEEAEGSTGGRGGKGGDLLYRWGNPRAYGRGDFEDQQLFAQHDARWILDGHPGVGNILIFNNGTRWPARPYSSVIEIEPPTVAHGHYSIRAGSPFGPEEPAWEYTAPDERSFFADFISGSQRLTNGNTLVTSGPEGRFFEVTREGETVWEYRNRYSGDAANPLGDPPHSVFRATHIPPDHPAVADRYLRPLEPQPPAWRE